MLVSVLCSPMDCGPPGFSVHGIFQARILEWVATSFYRGSSWLRDQTLSLLNCMWHLLTLSHQGNPCSRIKIYTIELQSQKLRLRDESLHISVITCLGFMIKCLLWTLWILFLIWVCDICSRFDPTLLNYASNCFRRDFPLLFLSVNISLFYPPVFNAMQIPLRVYFLVTNVHDNRNQKIKLFP